MQRVTIRSKLKSVAGALLALAGTVGCAAPMKVMVASTYVGDVRASALYTVSSTQVESDATMYDYLLRVCDVADDGSETNCKDSAILRNVVP